MSNRIHNFNAGPAALPLQVLEQIREEFLDYKGTGMSITEISHRSKPFEEIVHDAVRRTKKLLRLGEEFHVLFVQGGASLQFTMVPMNLAGSGKGADYINTGTWSTKAIKEAKLLGKEVRVIATSEDKNFSYIPQHYEPTKGADYLHFTSNNTIKGTQWGVFPKSGDVPLVSDMSSDFMSRPFDAAPFGLVYAGAQKNIGPSGVALVLIRHDMLEKIPSNLPSMLSYKSFAESNSLYNTPSCFTIYAIGLVLQWLEDTIGGLEKMDAFNREKAKLIYEMIDRTGFYRGTAEKGSRSLMNVTFRLKSEELEAKFISEALRAGLGGLKGHRSVGGCRASIYNATGMNSVKALVQFMSDFEAKAG